MFALSDNHTPNSHNGKGFWARLGHILYHRKPKNHSSALNDQLTEPADFSALSDCGCLPPEAMSDGKPKRGVKMPSAEDIARANKLNHRFAKFHKQLGATYRAFCGGKNGFMVKRYVESCLSDGTPKINTTDMKPIGVGPASLVNFEKWHGISFHQFETADESEVAQKLKKHTPITTAKPSAKKTPIEKSSADTSETHSPAPAEVREIIEEAKETVKEQNEVIKKAEEKIKKVRKQRTKKEVSPAKAEAVIEQQEEKIEEAKEEIAEVKAEVKQEIAEVKSDDDDDDIAALIKSFSATVASL